MPVVGVVGGVLRARFGCGGCGVVRGGGHVCHDMQLLPDPVLPRQPAFCNFAACCTPGLSQKNKFTGLPRARQPTGPWQALFQASSAVTWRQSSRAALQKGGVGHTKETKRGGS